MHTDFKATHTVTLPDIGEGVIEGEVIAWLKRVGDELKQDEPVVVVMTDKATVELPAPEPGILSKQYFKVGEIAIKDKPLYDIVVGSSAQSTTTFVPKEKVLASPATRQLAKEQGLDIQTIQGTGKQGQVTSDDLTKKCPQKVSTRIPRFEGNQEEPLSGIRQLMADKMTESCRIIPHFSFFEQADLSRLVTMRDKIAEQAAEDGIKLTFMPFFIRALSRCITQFPLLNSSLDDARKMIIYHKPHNIGVAMAANFGLIVPVIKNVDRLSLKELIHAYNDIKKRAFENKLASSDMKDGTLTLTNFGAFPGASLGGTPIINYPEAAICGVARIQKMPTVVNNEIVIRDLMNVSFSFDHRLIDGQLAAKISSNFCYLLENPALLL